MSGFLGGGSSGGGVSTPIDLDGYSTKTTAAESYWANGSTGDDSNDGLTESTPKKTWVGVFALVPDIIQNDVIINARGIFNSVGFAPCKKVGIGGFILIDGGPDVVILSGPHTADISSTTSLGLSTLSMTPDEFQGMTLHILTGPHAGYRYQIHSHTATTFRTTRNFTVDPGAGATFQIERPATEAIAGNGFHTLSFSMVGNGTYVYLSRLYCGGDFGGITISGGNYGFSSCIFEVTGSSNNLYVSQAGTVTFGSTDLARTGETGSVVYDFSYRNGTSYIGPTSTPKLYSVNSLQIAPAVFVCKNLTIAQCEAITIQRGSRFSGSTFIMSCRSYDRYANREVINAGSGYAPVTFDSSSDGDGNGLTIIDSSMVITGSGANIVFENNAGHGLEIRSSLVSVRNTVQFAGTGNSGSGVYAHSDAQLLLQSGGSASTITGTVGNLTVTDPTTEESTWTDVYTNDISVSSLEELTIVKKTSATI